MILTNEKKSFTVQRRRITLGEEMNTYVYYVEQQSIPNRKNGKLEYRRQRVLKQLRMISDLNSHINEPVQFRLF